MRYKALRHKQEKDLFGHFMETPNGLEVGMSQAPQLLGMDATLEGIIAHNAENPLILIQIVNYDLVVVSLMIIEP